MTFWKKFYALCQAKGEAPSYVAAKIGVSRASVSAWKNEGSKPSMATRARLCEYFDLPAEYDWENDGEASQPDKPSRVRIPVYGRVAAGIPIEAITDITDYEEISEEMANNGNYIALTIHGHSMEPRMCENDIIIVRRQEDVESGDIAVVFINGGDATCKKIKKTQDGIMLISTNPAYEPMYFTNKQISDLPIRILGKVVEIRCKL